MSTHHAGAQRHWQAGLQALKARQWQEAADAFERGTRSAPDDALMWLNLGRARMAAGRLADAAAAARSALQLQPANALAVRMLSECLLQQHRPAEAAAAFDAFPADAARDADFHNAHGNALFQARRLQEAVGVFFQALALKVDHALVHYRLGLCFKDMGMTRESTECFRTAVSLDEGAVRTLALSLLVHESRQACDWRELPADTAALLASLDQVDDGSGQLLSPFALLAVESTPEQQRRMGAVRSASLARGRQPLPPAGPRRPGPIRVGYLSSDFHHHATAVLMAELLERRDRQRFEVTLYSHSRDDGTPLMHRIRAACEHFVDVTTLSDLDVARRMRADGIDIAVDLKGHTRGSRFELLAYRPAPVQVAYLGYPASSGADFIDYLIGDPVVTPLAHGPQYSEQIAQLPHCYQPNDRNRALPPCPGRAALGLPADAVVLCCFNQTYKISPHMLDAWAAILAGAPRAVLWMLAWNPHAQANLTRELGARGVGPERIFWAPKLQLEEHLARLQAADLFLDTWPCNAHTTASEALWAAVPVLTAPGPTFASRVAASLVSACGLPDLACASVEDYVQLGIALAREPEVLAGLKAQLASHRLSLPLFDTDRYTRDYEALLVRLFERAQAGLPPAPLAAEAPPATAAAPDAAVPPAPLAVAAPAPADVADTPVAPAGEPPLHAWLRQGRDPAVRRDTDTPQGLLHHRQGVRLLLAQVQETTQMARTVLDQHPLGAALEVSLLAKVDRPGWQALRGYLLGSGLADPRQSTPETLPLLLALEAADPRVPAHTRSLATLIDTLDVWHLAKLLRHPVLPTNGRLLRQLGESLLDGPASQALSGKGLFNLLMLGWACFEPALFDRWLQRARALSADESRLAADRDGAWPAVHVISREFRLPGEGPAVPDLATLRRERPRLRIALCLSGQMRGFRQAHATWRHLGLQAHDVQVFVHTWQEQGAHQPDPEIAASVARVLGTTPFAAAVNAAGLRHGMGTLQRRYPRLCATWRSDRRLSPQDLAEVFGPEVQGVLEDSHAPEFAGFSNFDRMHYKIQAAHAMALAAAEASGQPFDLIIRLRPDKLVRSDSTPPDWHQILHDSRAERRIWTEEDVALREGVTIGDQFAVGCPEVMTAYATAHSLVDLAAEQGWHQFPTERRGHINLAATCFYNGLRVQRLPGVAFGLMAEAEPLHPQALWQALQADLPDGPQDALDHELWDALQATRARPRG